MFKSVYIYGLGMMGGSLAGAVKKSKMAQKIYAMILVNLILDLRKKIKSLITMIKIILNIYPMQI